MCGSSVGSYVESWSTGQRGPPTWCERVPSAVDDVDAHRPRGAGDDLLGGIEVTSVEVDHLGLGDVASLGPGDPADLLQVRFPAALLDPGRCLDQDRCRRRLQHERECAVLVDRDL